MNWYYAENKQQVGPVSEQDFKGLISSGKVNSETLVWHEGLDKWTSYGQLMPPPIERVRSGKVKVCGECGRLFSENEMQQLGTLFVCETCAPDIIIDTLKEKTKTPVSMVYGSFLIRGVAKVIDVVLLGIILTGFIILFKVMGLIELDFLTASPGEVEPMMLEFQRKLVWVQIIVNMIYSSYFHGKYGATPGKMVCKLKVVCADGSNISYSIAIRRYCGEILSGIFMVGYMMALFDKQKRALHDMLADTRVISDQ